LGDCFLANLKKDKQLLIDIDNALSHSLSPDEFLNIIHEFESINEELRDECAINLYQKLWPIALSVGKISYANSYAQKTLNHLIEYKRVPKLKELILTLKENGLCKKFIKEQESVIDSLLGIKAKNKKPNLNFIQFLADHPEHWREDTDFLKLYLQLESTWKLDEWKYCYALVLKGHFDKEIFYSLYEKSFEQKKEKYIKLFEELLKQKKVQYVQLKNKQQQSTNEDKDKFNVDYDQLAFNLLSGKIEPSEDEQHRVIQSLMHLTDEELVEKGHDMVVAFELLGMEQVVFNLCEKMISLEKDFKKKASIYFIWSQALFNNEEYHKSIHLIDRVIDSEPLIQDELTAFLYLKAEAFFKIKNYKLAQNVYREVKKYNSQYRMVKERLKVIEENK
jgi:hypothetical protein